MTWLRRIRFAAAILLLCTVFLPLSQCSQRGESVKPPSAKALAHARHWFPRSDTEFEYQYGVKNLGLSLNGAITLIAFVWPVVFIAFGSRFRVRRWWWIFAAVELLLCAGSAYWIAAMTLGGRWLYGAYVGETAIAAYACTTLLLAVEGMRSAGDRFGPRTIV